MHINYFGDSYDIVKQSLIRWLRPLGQWSVHPMFTESASKSDSEKFERFLAVDLISREVLTRATGRDSYFARCRET